MIPEMYYHILMIQCNSFLSSSHTSVCYIIFQKYSYHILLMFRRGKSAYSLSYRRIPLGYVNGILRRTSIAYIAYPSHFFFDLDNILCHEGNILGMFLIDILVKQIKLPNSISECYTSNVYLYWLRNNLHLHNHYFL